MATCNPPAAFSELGTEERPSPPPKRSSILRDVIIIGVTVVATVACVVAGAALFKEEPAPEINDPSTLTHVMMTFAQGVDAVHEGRAESHRALAEKAGTRRAMEDLASPDTELAGSSRPPKHLPKGATCRRAGSVRRCNWCTSNDQCQLGLYCAAFRHLCIEKGQSFSTPGKKDLCYDHITEDLGHDHKSNMHFYRELDTCEPTTEMEAKLIELWSPEQTHMTAESTELFFGRRRRRGGFFKKLGKGIKKAAKAVAKVAKGILSGIGKIAYGVCRKVLGFLAKRIRGAAKKVSLKICGSAAAQATAVGGTNPITAPAIIALNAAIARICSWQIMKLWDKYSRHPQNLADKACAAICGRM